MSEAFESVQKGTAGLVQITLSWWEALTRPDVLSRNLLERVHSRKNRITTVFKVWVVAFLITLMLEIPIHKLVGIHWNDIDFYVPASLVLLLSVLVAAAGLHAGLRMAGIDSKLDDTLTLYTVRAAPLSPIYAVLNYALLIRIVTALKSAKTQDLSAWKGIQFVFGSLASNDPSNPIDWVQPLLSFLGQVLSFVVLYMFARSVLAHYKTEKFQTYSGIGLGLYVSFIPILILVAIYYFVVYVAVQL